MQICYNNKKLVIFVKDVSKIRGYTLVELLVVIAVSTILMGILTAIIISANNQYARVKKDEETFTEIQMIRKAITNELKADPYKKYLLQVEKENGFYDTLKINKGEDQISFQDKVLTIKSRHFTFKHIDEILFSRYKSIPLLIITIKYGEDLSYTIYFSCLEIQLEEAT